MGSFILRCVLALGVLTDIRVVRIGENEEGR